MRRHDVGEATLGVLEAPRVAARVLLHLECRGRHATRVGRLAGSERDTGLVERVDRRRGAGHVRALDDGAASVLDQGASVRSSSSFCVAHGSARSHGTLQIESVENVAPRRSA
jgi:hypothetical protein